MKMREPRRLNIRLSADLNDWLDKESKKTGISKTATVAFATEQYREKKEISTSDARALDLLSKK